MTKNFVKIKKLGEEAGERRRAAIEAGNGR